MHAKHSPPADEKPELTPLEVASCKTGVPIGPMLRAKGATSRRRIVVKEASACYHLMSRTAGGDFLFDAECKEAFVMMMRRMEAFCGLQVLTYCVMDNHFHILVRVPDRDKWLKHFESFSPGDAGEERLLKHLKTLYSKAFVSRLQAELENWRSQGNESFAQECLQKFKDRMCDISLFMKELKERFTRWYNKQRGRRGTLWMDRYKSVLVQDGKALRMIAAYIDLNPVRAKIVKEGEPESYRWCGYAEAVGAGDKKRRQAQKALKSVMEAGDRQMTISRALELYRNYLLLDGSPNDLKAMVKEGELAGKSLNGASFLRCRVRYFTEGRVIGAKSFVEMIVQSYRNMFGSQREPKTQELLGGDYELSSLGRLADE